MTVNFNGSWKANLFRSTFLGPAPSALSVTIGHVDPRLQEEIFVIKTDASQDRAVFHCETSNRPGTCSLNGSTVRGTARWEASELVIETWVHFGSREMHFRDCWSLSADARILQMEHRQDDLHGQRIVFERSD
jgi:hypothetical protein